VTPITILRPRRRVQSEIDKDLVFARLAKEADAVLGKEGCQRQDMEYISTKIYHLPIPPHRTIKSAPPKKAMKRELLAPPL
jgi:hypothetical protein